jgi:hypothetical protein
MRLGHELDDDDHGVIPHHVVEGNSAEAVSQ